MTRGEKLSEGAWRSHVRSFIVRSSEKWEAVYQRNHFRTYIPCTEYTLESFAVSLHSCRYVCVRACVRTCVDACRENARVGLYIAASCFIGTNLSLV